MQTLKERKLRRAARRLMEVLRLERAGVRAVDDEKAKLTRYLRHIAAAYPDLTDLLSYHDNELLAFLQHAAEEEETRANQARLAGWKDKQDRHPKAFTLGQGFAGGATDRYGRLCCGP